VVSQRFKCFEDAVTNLFRCDVLWRVLIQQVMRIGSLKSFLKRCLVLGMSAATRIKKLFYLESSISKNYIWWLIVIRNDLCFFKGQAEVLDELLAYPPLTPGFVLRREVFN